MCHVSSLLFHFMSYLFAFSFPQLVLQTILPFKEIVFMYPPSMVLNMHNLDVSEYLYFFPSHHIVKCTRSFIYLPKIS